MKLRNKMILTLEEIPDELLKKAYSLDLIRKTLQLHYSKDIYNMFTFHVKDRFLETKLFNGVIVIMEATPQQETFDFK